MFGRAAVRPESGSTVGYNVGADVAYYFSGKVGIGWLTRYSRGNLEVASAGEDTLDIQTGGLPHSRGVCAFVF